MSKTTLRKAIAEFSPEQLRGLIFDIYDKSKDAKEILDFYADPDVEKKLDQFKTLVYKEIYRTRRRYNRPRIPRLRAAVKRFAVFEPGDENVAELMVYIVEELCRMSDSGWLNDTTVSIIVKFFKETLEYIAPRMLLDSCLPRLERAIALMPSRDSLCRCLTAALDEWRDGRE